MMITCSLFDLLYCSGMMTLPVTLRNYGAGVNVSNSSKIEHLTTKLFRLID